MTQTHKHLTLEASVQIDQEKLLSLCTKLTPKIHLLHPELDNGFKPEIYRMLDEQSKAFYKSAIKKIEQALILKEENFASAISPFFYVFENEFFLSITQFARWCQRVPLEYYNRPWIGMKIRIHGTNKKRPVDLNQVEYDEKGVAILVAKTVGEIINALEFFWKKENIVVYDKGNDILLNDFRKCVDAMNPLRHFQHPFVSYDTIIRIKKSLEGLFNIHLPLLYTMKLELNGTLPPNLILKMTAKRKKNVKHDTIEILDESAD